MNRLRELHDLRLNVRQSGFQCSPPYRTRRALRKDIFSLQVQSLFFARPVRPHLFCRPTSFFFCHPADFDFRLLQCICHLIYPRFTFPTMRPIFILRGFLPERPTDA